MQPILKYGNTGPDVKYLQVILKRQGFYTGHTGGNYLVRTEAAVKYFQSTHIGPDGEYLDVDGVVGPDTWWALENPSGDPQRNFLNPRIPEGLTNAREDVLSLALREHSRGVREIPDGSNWGKDIAKYGGRKGWAWCSLFVTWAWSTVGVVGFKQPSTYKLWQRAQDEGWFYPVTSFDPRARIPGNAMLWQHKKQNGAWTRTGHISLIVRVSPKGDRFNTVGGNEGNRVKFGRRADTSKGLVGFINPFGNDEQPIDFERGLVTNAKKVEALSTR